MINSNIKKRVIKAWIAMSLLFFALIIRIGYIQLIKGDELGEQALSQQTRDVPIEAKRGTIYDRKGKELAISVSKSTVWARPSEIMNKKKSKAEQQQQLKTAAKVSAKVLGQKEEDILKKFKEAKEGSLIRLERWIDDDKEKLLKEELKKNKVSGIWTAADNRRYYPFDNFASYVLGHVSADNSGVAGLELQYDKILKGLPGRMIVSTDASGREIPLGNERYNEAQDGLGLILTIDEVIQHYAEKAVDKAIVDNNSKLAYAIVMDPNTGDVLAMAAKPDYNPNDPKTPIHPVFQAELDSYDEEHKTDGLFKMWRNPMINDIYEPGSTFKLITSAAGIEEGLVTPDEVFYDKGYLKVADRIIKCWRDYNPHGRETFTQAVQNSCNPIFIEVAQRLGVDKLYDYINAFGLRQVTGIDLPGEAKGISYDKEKVGPVELATISFGQSISVNAMQLINSVCAIANDGKLMKPRVVKELVDINGKVTERFEPEFIKQVISKETSKTLLEIMESVVTEGSGKAAYIPGYHVGAKTATAQKVVNGQYAGYVASFVAVAPINDPKVVVLVAIDDPQAGNHYGSTVGGPVARDILYDTLRYLDVKPSYTEQEKKMLVKEETTVPDIMNLTLEKASLALSQDRLNFIVEPNIYSDKDAKIVDIFPKPGSQIPVDSVVTLYVQSNDEIAKPQDVVMPDLTGKTIKECTNILNGLNLQMKPSGSGKAVNQNPAPNTVITKNSIVTVEFK